MLLRAAVVGILAGVCVCASSQAEEVKRDEIYSPYVVGENATQVFWGDTHLHTSYSADAGMVGNTLGPDVAYRFALGHEITTSSGLSLPRFRRHTISHESAVGVCHDEANTTNIYEGVQV
jgi:hypothetical protein